MESVLEPSSPTGKSTAKTLSARGLKKSYGSKQVVKGVDFDVQKGEIVALFGPNGAGKTTSFYMLVGFVQPDSGKISLGSTEITKLPMHQRAKLGMGYLPQEASAFRRLTARENLLAILEFQPLNKTQREEKAKELLDELGIYQLKDKVAQNLSGGERRRLEIARSLCTNPEVILLDEPFTGVDPKNVHDIQKLIFDLRDRRGVGIFITDHSVRETLAITDRVYLMYDGQVAFHGNKEEFARDSGVRTHYLGDEYEL